MAASSACGSRASSADMIASRMCCTAPSTGESVPVGERYFRVAHGAPVCEKPHVLVRHRVRRACGATVIGAVKVIYMELLPLGTFGYMCRLGCSERDERMHDAQPRPEPGSLR